MIPLLFAGCGTPPEPPPAASPPSALPVALPPSFDLGRAPTADEVAAWDIDVNPAWAGLPEGHGSVAEGQALFAAKCVACHGPDAMGGQGWLGPRLIATEPLEGFQDDWHLPRTIGNFWPYASTLFDYVHRAMPQNAPGSLSADQTYALVAFLLAQNQVVGADFVADGATIRTVKMPTRVQFVPDDRPSTTSFR